MTTLEIRRHSMRKSGGGSQLSQQGVAHARALGAMLGPFAQVVTSVLPRTRETAIAMGFAVDYELVMLPAAPAVYAENERSRWWAATQPFAALAQLLAERSAVWQHAHTIAAQWRDICTAIPTGSAALCIGHSGDLEMGLVACFPDADHTAWGSPFGFCEGARLHFTDHFADVELVRQAVQPG